MKAPRTVQVLAQRIKITEVAHLVDDDTEQDLHGYYLSDDQIIALSTSQGDDMRRRTLLHELFHAIFEAVAVTEQLNHHDVKLEERIVKAISGVTLDTLRRNPALVMFLLEK